MPVNLQFWYLLPVMGVIYNAHSASYRKYKNYSLLAFAVCKYCLPLVSVKLEVQPLDALEHRRHYLHQADLFYR